MTRTAEYQAWRGMKRRCYAKSYIGYQIYGGRGIRVSPKWRHDFAAFFREVGLRPSSEHSLDRIDVNGHYEPGNVRWATKQQQGNNRRNNRRVPFYGYDMTIAQIAKVMCIDWKTAKRRYAK